MDRLSLLLSLLTGAVLTGGLATLAFASGWFGWVPLIASAIIGFALAWPVAYVISRRIKRNDPHFDHRRIRDVDSSVPKPGRREV